MTNPENARNAHMIATMAMVINKDFLVDSISVEGQAIKTGIEIEATFVGMISDETKDMAHLHAFLHIMEITHETLVLAATTTVRETLVVRVEIPMVLETLVVLVEIPTVQAAHLKGRDTIIEMGDRHEEDTTVVLDVNGTKNLLTA